MTGSARTFRRLLRDERGVTMIETAFALPVLIVMIYCIAQLGLLYRAVSGMQHALGEGARLATLCVNLTASGCDAPTDQQIKEKMEEAVYGVGPGDFNHTVTPIDDPATPTIDESRAGWRDLEVTYTQRTSLLLFPGPTVTVTRNKRAWVAD
jgi:Flp pilus assembly pilin Flp